MGIRRATVIGILAVGLLAGPAAGVAAQDGSATPTALPAAVGFTGRLAYGPCSEGFCQPRVAEAFTDPRLAGDAYVWGEGFDWTDGGEIGGMAIGSFTIVGEDGAWRGVPTPWVGDATSVVLVGEGAYDGLTAVAQVVSEGETWDWHGWIIEGSVPLDAQEPAAIP